MSFTSSSSLNYMNESTLFNNSLSNLTNNPSSNEILWPSLVNTFICLMGLITVSINILIFAHPTLKDPTYKLLLTEAFTDLIYLSCSALWPLFQYALNAHSLAVVIYSIAIDDYLTSSLAINDILIELFLSVDRLFIILNKSAYLQRLPLTFTIGTLNLASLLFYLPVLFLRKIVEQPERNKYKLVLTPYLGQTTFGALIPTILSCVRLFLVMVCLFSVNLVTLVKFRKHIKQRSRLVSKVNHGKSGGKSKSSISTATTNSSISKKIICI